MWTGVNLLKVVGRDNGQLRLVVEVSEEKGESRFVDDLVVSGDITDDGVAAQAAALLARLNAGSLAAERLTLGPIDLERAAAKPVSELTDKERWFIDAARVARFAELAASIPDGENLVATLAAANQKRFLLEFLE